MIDHLGIKVRNFEASKKFYLAALGPLGYSVVMEFGGIAAGLGVGRKPDFWISQGEPSGPIHLAIASDTRAPVDAFYKAAMAAGAKDNGPPGVREHYHPNYYGAFVFDLDGNNLEAVCHLPQGKAKARAKKTAPKKAAPKKAAPKKAAPKKAAPKKAAPKKAAPKKAAPKKAAPKKNSAKKPAKRRG